ncbi:MAG: mycothiol conjugate amidase Mca [Chloroflexi bacterium]|nr:mycothiol conjugate amidase Mca [Chloroflexota bacterium]
MPDRRSLLAVHAHPDDEASKGAGTVAKYTAEGVHTALVCCTGGEAGDILNPAMDKPEVRENIGAVRMQELRESTRIIGYETVHLLGYHDSGMPDTETNKRPDNFANAPFDEAVDRLIAIVRLERPQVLITYADDRKFYPHPDHIRVHEISVAAFDAAADPDRRPDLGSPWQIQKMYYTGFSLNRIKKLDAAYRERGMESPYQRWFERGIPEDWQDPFTTYVNVQDFFKQRSEALLAHRTQIDPEGHWFRLPDEVVKEIVPWEEFILARALVAVETPENDLFAGVR